MLTRALKLSILDNPISRLLLLRQRQIFYSSCSNSSNNNNYHSKHVVETSVFHEVGSTVEELPLVVQKFDDNDDSHVSSKSVFKKNKRSDNLNKTNKI